jgi:hypothetical protein
MIHSPQGTVMAQLRRIFYCPINLARTLIPATRPIVAIKLPNEADVIPDVRRRISEDRRQLADVGFTVPSIR